jgi:hypothetical protein
MEGSSGKPPRSWEEIVQSRGVAILMQLTMPVLHDRGGDTGRSTKCRISEIRREPDGKFAFILEIPADNERRRLVGEDRFHLSCLQELFAITVRETFPTGERPEVVVGILDPGTGGTVWPQELWLESELDSPENDPEDEDPGGGD